MPGFRHLHYQNAKAFQAAKLRLLKVFAGPIMGYNTEIWQNRICIVGRM